MSAASAQPCTTSSELRARQAIFAGAWDTLAHPIIQGPVTEEFARLMGAKRVPHGDHAHDRRKTTRGWSSSRSTWTSRSTRPTINPGRTRETQDRDPRGIRGAALDLVDEGNDRNRQGKTCGWSTPAAECWWPDRTRPPDLRGHRELELLQDAGIAPADIIPIATLNGAVFLGLQHEFGSIEPGKHADMVLLSANPAEDINNAKTIVEVIKGGRIIDRSALNLPVNR